MYVCVCVYVSAGTLLRRWILTFGQEPWLSVRKVRKRNKKTSTFRTDGLNLSHRRLQPGQRLKVGYYQKLRYSRTFKTALCATVSATRLMHLGYCALKQSVARPGVFALQQTERAAPCCQVLQTFKTPMQNLGKEQ